MRIHEVHELRRTLCRWSWRHPQDQLCNNEAAVQEARPTQAPVSWRRQSLPAHCQTHTATKWTLREPCTTPTKRTKTIMGLEICELKAGDDVYDPTSDWPQPNLSENVGESANNDD